MKVAFIDRDGTLIWEPTETKQVDSIEKLEILPGVFNGLQTLQLEGYNLVMVTNQDGIGSSSFPEDGFNAPQRRFIGLLEEQGIAFTEVYICPHKQEDNCNCRKPRTGMVDDFLRKNEVELDESLMIGDRDTDEQFAQKIGVRFIRMETNGCFPRFAQEKRETRETSIEAFVNLDGSGISQIETGIGFFDHMLDLVAKHSLIDLTLKANGDLNVDEHHTVEDTGLVLGTILSKALGDKRSIERYGFWVPMDEALAYVVIDLSGRPYFVFEGNWKREYVGELPTELISHFFESLTQTLKCNLHMKIERGENEHHKVEALFKGLGRALRLAVRKSPYESTIPSTKGLL